MSKLTRAFLTIVALSIWVWGGLGTSGLIGCGSAGVAPVAPVANAGADVTSLVSRAVAIDGSSSTGTISSSMWSIESAPTGSTATLSSASTLQPSITPDVVGDYTLKLSINNGASTDTMVLTVKTINAILSVPSDSTVTSRTRLGNSEYTIDLSATGGTISAAGSDVADNAGAVTYSWVQVAGPAATLNDASSAVLDFTAPGMAAMLNPSDRVRWQPFPISLDDTKMVFRLTITDENSNTDTETIAVHLTDNGSEIHTQGGLLNVPIGQKLYLQGPDTKTFATASASAVSVTDWSWTLTSKPDGSSATLANDTTEFPSFTPDVVGTYIISYNSTTGNTTTTAPSTKVPGTVQISAATYVGVGGIVSDDSTPPVCASCHSGTVEEDLTTKWQGTMHSTIFSTSMDAYVGLTPEPYLWEYHTVGFNKDSTNGGFDELGFAFPATGLTYASFVADNPDVAKLSSVQCENCHGPGSEHFGNPTAISRSPAQSGICGQCHHEEAEWKNSNHNTTYSYSMSNWVSTAGCTRCHTAEGFKRYIEEGEEGLADLTSASASVVSVVDPALYGNVACVACHDPHSAENPSQLRRFGEVTMIASGATVNAGKAAVCYTCHDGNYSYGEVDCDSDRNGTADEICETIYQSATQYSRGPSHHNPQSAILEGVEGIANLDEENTNPSDTRTYTMSLTENSFHSDDNFILANVSGNPNLSTTNDKCITCHMFTAPTAEEEGYQEIGGHAFAMVTTDSNSEELENVAPCQACHTDRVATFNRPAYADYDGDGSLEGVQDEVKGLLLNLTTKILAYDTTNLNQTSGTKLVSGVVTPGGISTASGKKFYNIGVGSTKTWAAMTDAEKRTNKILLSAMHNHNMIVNDASYGIHNTAYTVQILQETYKALGVMLDSQSASSYSYKTAFPSATLR